MKITSYVVDQPGGTRKVIQAPHTGERLVANVSVAGSLTVYAEGQTYSDDTVLYAFAPGFWSTVVVIPE
jgi:hypothetical protein